LNLETFVEVVNSLVVVALMMKYIADVVESYCGVDTAVSFDLLIRLETFLVVVDCLLVVALTIIYIADVVES